MNPLVLSDVFLTFSGIFGIFGVFGMVALVEKSLVEKSFLNSNQEYKRGSESFILSWGAQIIFISLSFILYILSVVLRGVSC